MEAKYAPVLPYLRDELGLNTRPMRCSSPSAQGWVDESDESDESDEEEESEEEESEESEEESLNNSDGYGLGESEEEAEA